MLSQHATREAAQRARTVARIPVGGVRYAVATASAQCSCSGMARSTAAAAIPVRRHFSTAAAASAASASPVVALSSALPKCDSRPLSLAHRIALFSVSAAASHLSTTLSARAMWASMTSDKPAASTASLFSAPVVQSFKFNFGGDSDGAPSASMEDAAMQDAQEAPATPGRPALQHRAPSVADNISAADLEVITLQPESSTFSTSAFAASSAFAGSAASAAAASSSSSSSPAPVRFLKRRVGASSSKSSTSLEKLLAQSDSDLLPQVYEGGFKIWECAIDLICFIKQQSEPLQGDAAAGSSSSQQRLFPSGFHGQRVVELGCGHAFPALFTLQRGASYVAMQDYNSEVIEDCTVDNARLNATTLNGAAMAAHAAASTAAGEVDGILSSRCGFFSGDWSDPVLLSLLTPPPVSASASAAAAASSSSSSRYDLLLSSDTLYSLSYFRPLWNLIRSLLSPRGVALIAAKRYYFGIGGSTDAFLDLVREDDEKKEWIASVGHVVEDGRSNIREILVIRRTEEGVKRAEEEEMAQAQAQAAADGAASM